jgi:hypothetical protein
VGSGLGFLSPPPHPSRRIHAPDGARNTLGFRAQAVTVCLLAFDYAGGPLRAKATASASLRAQGTRSFATARKLAGRNFAPGPCTPRP